MDKKVKGRISAILLSLAMLFTMMPMMAAPSYADSTQIEVGGIKYDLNTENYAASVTGYVGQPTEVTIPATVKSGEETYTVTSIQTHAFQDCDSLTNVTIPNSVTSIGMGSFERSGITGVAFESGSHLTSIGNYAFKKCSSLGTITIPNSVTSIGMFSFEESGLTSVSFESGSRETSIGDYAFQNCVSLTDITISDGVTSIGNYAFKKCSSLGTITIPNSVTSIGMFSFEESGLTSVSFESGSRETSIGDYAFKSCVSLADITISDGVTSIGDYAFQYCVSLTDITIPNSVTSIGKASFEGTGLTSVSFESGNRETSIGEYAFKSCNSLGTITIPNSVESMGNGVFEESGLTSVTFESGSSLKSIPFHAFFNCVNLRSITIPNSVTNIYAGAFEKSGLTSAIIPNSVTTIEYNAFGPCGSLSTIFYVGTEEQWNNMTNRDVNWTGGNAIKVLFVKGVEYIIEAPKGKTLTYNGKEQTGVATRTGYTLTGASATNAGTYEATATLEDEYVWADGTTDPKTIDWKIDKDIVKVTVPRGKTFKYNGKEQTGVTAGNSFTLSGTTKATSAGSYTAKATLKENPDPNYLNIWADGTDAPKTIKWTINKANNPLVIQAKTATIKYSKLKKKAQSLAVTKVIKFTKQLNDKKTYTLSSAKKGKKSFKKYFKINKKTGKVTVKKGLKKGTYKVKVKVKAAGNANYNPSALKSVTFKVKVK